MIFTDTGLAAYLLGIGTAKQAARDPLRGSLYENLVIIECLKQRLNLGKRPELYFFRDTHGNEVDLVMREERKLIPIEIKSAATFTADFLKGIDRFRRTVGERCTDGFVLYNGRERFNIKGTEVLNPLYHGEIPFVR